MDDQEKEARRKRQAKKMTKLIAKAWDLPHAEHFQQCGAAGVGADGSPTPPLDLTSIGQTLDAGGYHLGRHGWEKFASDLGGVYNRFLSQGKHKKSARRNLDEVKGFLAKVDPHLAEIAEKSNPEGSEGEAELSSAKASTPAKKRKVSDAESNDKLKKKKKPQKDDTASRTAVENLTISQREERALEQLGNYLEECGGKKKQARSFTCKVTQVSTTEKYDSVFYSQAGKRLRSMIAVAKFLSLVDDDKSSASAIGKKSKAVQHGIGRPKNKRDLESEQRKLKKEMDKLLKAHEKATKSLDEHRSDHRNDRYPVEDEVLMEEEGQAESDADLRHLCNPDIDGFPGIPIECTPDLLMVWDFLCTFSRPLSLEPISLDDFAAALVARPTDTASPPPLYLAEVHLALLRLLLGDTSSDEWWWSTLETEETETEEGKGAGESNSSTRRREEQLIPVIKCDLAALLAFEEEPDVTTKWLQSLEDVRNKKPNSAGPIKSALKNAISITTNSLVKSYLRKAMKQMKPNSAGLTKRAAVWLVDRVKEARPDLWGREVSKEEISQQSKSVADEAALYMDQVDENANAVLSDAAFEDEEVDQESDSDDDEMVSDDEDDDDDQEAPISDNNTTEIKTSLKSDGDIPVTSAVPPKPAPSIVDLLLPPGKPLPGSDLISPFTWPCLAGAASCRILHRYKRKRNEVDDSLRELRELPRLSVAERRRRETDVVERVLSECFLTDRFGEVPIEAAIRHLCEGENYSQLTPVQKLCVMRLLVEAAYDSERVSNCVEENIKARITASKALDNEERRAKKEEREEKARVEARARERLAHEAREALIEKKRRELTRANKKTHEYTIEFLEGLTDEDVAEFDEDTKAEFDALPEPSSFSRSNVNAMVAKIHEEDAFDTDTLVVLTLEEIEAREDDILKGMNEELNAFGDFDTIYQHADRETTSKIDKLRREIADFKEALLSLPQVRASAMEGLRDAIEDGTIKALKTAMKVAEQAWLTGADEDTDGVWALDLLRDAALELKSSEKRKRVAQAQRDLIAKRNKCFVRTEPIGRDKHRNSFWNFDNDATGRVWVEAEYVLRDDVRADDEDVDDNLVDSTVGVKIGADDEEKDILSDDLYFVGGSREKFNRFSRKEYHSTGSVASLAKRHWGCDATDKSLRSLMKNLDNRGLRESALKSNLKEIVEAIAVLTAEVGTETVDSTNDTMDGSQAEQANAKDNKAMYQTSGDDEQFRAAVSLARTKNDVGSFRIAFDLIEDIPSALAQRVRLRKVVDLDGDLQEIEYEMGSVTGWKMEDILSEVKNTGQENAAPGENQDDMKTVVKTTPIWGVDMDNGGEAELSGPEAIEGIARFLMWRTQYEGYTEENYDLNQYRNSMGRFCGRVADAPYASSAAFLARLMIKKEQDLYPPLKNRLYENNWGGKSGARNAWIASVKEYGHDMETLRNGLLTLEEVFFGFCGSFDALEGTNEMTKATNDNRTGRELLNDDKHRFEIELELFGQSALSGLWNSPNSRNIFKEIVSTCKNVGTLALCLDLLCRNTKTFLDATQPKTTTRKAAANNAAFEQPDMLWGSSRRSASRQQSYSQFFD